MRVEGKVFVVTGAGNGIGREVALELVARGATVVGADIDEAGLAATAALVADASRFDPRRVDAAEPAAITEFATAAIAAHGAVDGLFNIAGIAQRQTELVEGITDDRIEAIMRVNFLGPLGLTRAFLPELRSRPEALILLTSSMAAITSVPGSAIYAASKAAVAMLGEGLVHDLRRTPRVTVTTVFPGTTWTAIVRDSAAELGVIPELARRFAAKPERVAHRMIEAARSGRRRVAIGPDAKLFALLVRVNRRVADRLAYAEVARGAYRDPGR